MATHDYVIDNGSGAVVRSDLNSALSAIASNNSNATAPSTTYAYMWWCDTTTGLLKQRNSTNTAWISKGLISDTFLTSSDIGATVQGYDANTVKKNVANTFTASQRAAITTDNDLSFDQSAANNFFCTPASGGTLTFTNHTEGQSGFILLVNGSNYAIAAAATTKIKSSDLTAISSTGTYLLSYLDNGTNAYVVCSGNLA